MQRLRAYFHRPFFAPRWPSAWAEHQSEPQLRTSTKAPCRCRYRGTGPCLGLPLQACMGVLAFALARKIFPHICSFPLVAPRLQVPQPTYHQSSAPQRLQGVRDPCADRWHWPRGMDSSRSRKGAPLLRLSINRCWIPCVLCYLRCYIPCVLACLSAACSSEGCCHSRSPCHVVLRQIPYAWEVTLPDLAIQPAILQMFYEQVRGSN